MFLMRFFALLFFPLLFPLLSTLLFPHPFVCGEQILKGQRYTEKADVFSFGIMMWEVVSRDRPYANQDPLRLNLEIVNGLRPTPPRNAEAALVQLMNKCWDGDEKARPGFAEIHDSLVGM
eukprot:TRINITY_DN1006_c0_g1_i17.p2 TRINITY_DN1006_c0_g1~~TRINITY_DN1006_c0_g1_i17.p2  ORF type:complete len:120 (+),score=20.70 TRINITY_DN1006_c0_g1_i17:354-713(+)